MREPPLRNRRACGRWTADAGTLHATRSIPWFLPTPLPPMSHRSSPAPTGSSLSAAPRSPWSEAAVHVVFGLLRSTARRLAAWRRPPAAKAEALPAPVAAWDVGRMGLVDRRERARRASATRG
jgi:hypothetical protein